jgi:hypothetical protein
MIKQLNLTEVEDFQHGWPSYTNLFRPAAFITEYNFSD